MAVLEPSALLAIVRLTDVICDPNGIWLAPSPNRRSKRTMIAGFVPAAPSTTVTREFDAIVASGAGCC